MRPHLQTWCCSSVKNLDSNPMADQEEKEAPPVAPAEDKKPLVELPVDGDGAALKKQLEEKNAIASSINPNK